MAVSIIQLTSRPNTRGAMEKLEYFSGLAER